MTHRDRVVEFVSKIAPKAICDDCLASRLGFSARQRANQITRPLSQSPSFEKSKRICSFCNDTKLSISSKKRAEKYTRQATSPTEIVPKKSQVPKLGLKSLREIGFQKVGLWALNENGLSLQLLNKAKLKPALYAFVANDEILYVGKTSRELRKRLYHYTRPGPTQATNIRLNQFLLEALSQRKVLEIFAFGTDEISRIGPFIIDVPAAIEDDIIRKTKPIWNVRRSK